MSQAPPPIDRDAEMLARLAELDLSAAEHVHAKLIAAVDAAEIADLGRSYQRVSRSLRQTLALKAKLVRERASTEAMNRIRQPNPIVEGFATDDQAMELTDAVERITEMAFAGDEERITSVLGRFDCELDDWIDEEGFADADLDEQVLRACRALELPEELAAVWRSLPRPTFSPDPATNDSPEADTAAEPPRPWSSSA